MNLEYTDEELSHHDDMADSFDTMLGSDEVFIAADVRGQPDLVTDYSKFLSLLRGRKFTIAAYKSIEHCSIPVQGMD